jgi:hypothetical protein
MRAINSWIFFLHITCLLACSTGPDGNNAPGTCSLDCRSAKIGSNEMRVRFLSPPKLDLYCYGLDNTAYPNNVPIRFVVEKRNNSLPAEKRSTTANSPAESAESDTASGSDSTTDATPVAGENWVPVSGVSFSPLLLQGEGGVTNADPRDRYQGVVTPPGDWCTDSCGVGAVDFKPLCRTALNDIQLGIVSGSLSGTIQILVNP